jgi:hypothetical protein
MLRKLIQAGAIIALLTGPCFAQSPQVPQSGQPSQSNIGIPLSADKTLTPEEIERRKATDRAYNAAMQKIPDKKPPADPWGSIRPNSPTASKTKQQ